MKKTNYSSVLSSEPLRNPKKRRGKTNFTNSKQKRRRESKKKVGTSIVGRRTPSIYSEQGEEELRPSWRLDCKIQPLNLA